MLQAEKDHEELCKAFREANQPPKLTKNIPLRQQRILLEESLKASNLQAATEPAELQLPKYGGFVGFFSDRATIIDESRVGTASLIQAA